MDKKQSKLSSRTIQWLLQEITDWEKEGIINPDQKEQLRGRYQAEAASPRTDYVTLIISTIGALLIGLGIILFFAYNWDKIPRVLRLALILVTMTASYIGGRWGRERYPDYKGIGEAFIFLGVILFGSGIWLIAQMYNIVIEYPWGWLYWALAATAITYTAVSIPVSLLSTFLWLAWAIAYSNKWTEANYMFMPLAALAIFPFAYYKQSPLVLWGGLLCLFFGTLFATGHFIMFYVLSTMGLVFIQAGNFHFNKEKGNRFTVPYLITGFFSLVLGLYIGSFYGYQNTFIGGTKYNWNLTLIIGIWAACGFIMTLLSWQFWKSKVYPTDYWSEIIRKLLPVLILIYSLSLPLLIQMGQVDNNYTLISAILSNFLLLFTAGSLLYLGQKDNRLSFMYVGTIIFLLIAIGRYFDLFDNRLHRSVYFLVIGGLFVWYSYWLSKKHKEIRAMQREDK